MLHTLNDLPRVLLTLNNRFLKMMRVSIALLVFKILNILNILLVSRNVESTAMLFYYFQYFFIVAHLSFEIRFHYS